HSPPPPSAPTSPLPLHDALPICPRARDRLDPAAPVVWGTRLEVQLVEQTRADRREELVLAANVGIERHPLDAEEGPEAAHRDRVDALLVGELECALDDTIASEVAPLRG